MNILVFSWRDPKHLLAGGAEQVMHEHMKGWTEAGHKVTLFTSKFKGAKDKDIIDGIEIVRKGCDILGVQAAAFFWYLFGKHKKFDFVVDQFHGIPFFTPLYIRLPRLAVIQEVARDVWFVNRLPNPLKWIFGAFGYLAEPWVFIFYRKTVFMTGSESAKRNVSQLGKISLKKIRVIPHGIIVKRSVLLPKKENKFTIVFLGIHSKDKGIEDAIVVFDLLKDKNFQFWTIGKFETDSYEKKIRKMVKNLDLSDRVKFWGYVSQEEKFKLLERAHVLINPSVHEGWGLVNIEANAVGLPVIAYKSPGLTDSVRENESGVFVTENTPESMAQKNQELSENQKKYQKLQKGALKWSKKFSWERSKTQSLKLIEAIV